MGLSTFTHAYMTICWAWFFAWQDFGTFLAIVLKAFKTPTPQAYNPICNKKASLKDVTPKLISKTAGFLLGEHSLFTLEENLAGLPPP